MWRGYMGSDIIHSFIITREVLILTQLILIALWGCISLWGCPRDGSMMREWPYLGSECIKNCTYIPSNLEISVGPWDFPQAWPLGNISGLGKYLGPQGCTTQYIPPWAIYVSHTKSWCRLYKWYFFKLGPSGKIPTANLLLWITQWLIQKSSSFACQYWQHRLHLKHN